MTSIRGRSASRKSAESWKIRISGTTRHALRSSARSAPSWSAWSRYRRIEQGLDEPSDANWANPRTTTPSSRASATMSMRSQTCGKAEFQRMFSGQMDGNNAFVDIQAGAGGTEAQVGPRCCCACTCAGRRQWLKTEMLEASAGEVAGIRVRLSSGGRLCLRWLKTESACIDSCQIAIRFRQSPSYKLHFGLRFPGSRRQHRHRDHPADLKPMSTFIGRRWPARQQDRVRGTHPHVPSGVVAPCQTGRSQHANRDNAMKIARASCTNWRCRNAMSSAMHWRQPSRTSAG